MGKAVISVCFSCRFDSIERLFHGAIAQRMHVNNQPLLIRGDGQFGKPGRIEQQISRLACVSVGLGQGSGLRRIFQYAVGEYLDAGDGQVRNSRVLLPNFLNDLQFFRRFVPRFHLPKCSHMRGSFQNFPWP